MTTTEMAEYFRSHPPRCLAEFSVNPVEFRGATFEGLAFRPVFQVMCACGSDTGMIKGFHWRNPDYNNVEVFLSPIEFTCSACRRTSLLIDTDQHGYDAELGHGSATCRARGTPGVFQCNRCKSASMEVFAQFEYPDDLFEDDFPQARGRERDLFSWFFLYSRCAECGSQFDVTDFECA